MNGNKKAAPNTQPTPGRIVGGFFMGGRILSTLIRPLDGGGLLERPGTERPQAMTATAGKS